MRHARVRGAQALFEPVLHAEPWDEQAHADPAMPAAAEAKTFDEMPTFGAPSYTDTDTTLREQAHS